MSFRKRVASFLCAACMLVSILSVSRPAMVYAGSLDDQLQEARDAQAELEKQIEAVQADKSKAIEEKALLDQRNEMLRTEVNLIQQQADETRGSHYRADREGKGAVRAVLQAGATGGGAGHGFLLVGDFQGYRLYRPPGPDGFCKRSDGL